MLVATDNHVGYAEDDPIRGDDGWKTFEEIMGIAEVRDVDMVLLGGDLFHDHQPSRKSLYHVMESLRKHCLGNRPCSIDIIGDESEHFRGQFNYANYNDPNLNISIPVFSIHGNHDEPTGQEALASLDILQTSGLINYFGRQAEADKITVKPILMQKGTTKLALYGLSNVRDERLFQTFRTNNVKFLQPSVHKSEWYNLLAVHQNHVAHTDSSYLPESFLPSFMDLVIWGHEHECLIEPVQNPSKNFKVIQPGSSIATSLSPGEAKSKSVCILNITGKECKVEPIPLKTIRPFLYKDISLNASKEMVAVANKNDNLPQVKKYCKKIVDDMIKQANAQWLAANQDSIDEDEPLVPPKPLIRLRIEYTAPPSGGDFKVEQNRRFSKEYQGLVANDTDVFQFHRRRKGAKRADKVEPDMPDEAALEESGVETVKIGDLVHEYLGAQTMTILPRNLFTDAVTQFVDKGDKKAIDLFIGDTIKVSVNDLFQEDTSNADNDDTIFEAAMHKIRLEQEKRFQDGELRARSGAQHRPTDWDSDTNGHWKDDASAADGLNDNEDDDADAMLLDSHSPSEAPSISRGKAGRAPAAKTTRKPATTKRAAAAKKASTSARAAPHRATRNGRGNKKQAVEEDHDDDSPMLDDDDDDDVEIIGDSGGLFVSQASSAIFQEAPARSSSSKTTTAPNRPTQARAGTQTQLNFGNVANGTGVRGASTAASTSRTSARRHEPSDDEIDDDDAFEPPVPPARTTRRR